MNMYNSNGYVVSILANGKILPELADGSVLVPFGSEYVIRLRNKNLKRALVKIWIDGNNITEDGLVITGNSFVDLERPLDAAVKFRFVSTESEEACEAGKDGPDPQREMGVIRVEFTEEADLPRPVTRPTPQRKDWYLGGDYLNSRARFCGAGGQSMGLASYNCSDLSSRGVDMSAQASVNSLNFRENPVDHGCTVEGSHSSQEFVQTYFRPSGKQATVLQLTLKGDTRVHVAEVASSLKKSGADKLRRQEIAALKEQIKDLSTRLDQLS